MKYTCPCCGYKTLDEEPTDTYEICKICFWEDDGVQFRDPDYEGGANVVSLRQAQKKYIMFGACQEDCIEFVRNLNKTDIKDPNLETVIQLTGALVEQHSNAFLIQLTGHVSSRTINETLIGN